MSVFNSLLHYYLREKLWRSAINLCNEELKKGKDPIVNFWRGLAHFHEGSIIDAIRDCEPLQNTRDLRYSSVNAMIFYYNHYTATDNDKLTKLLEKLYDIENSSIVSDILTTARFFFYVNDYEKFDEIIDKLQENNSGNGEDLIVKGWRYCFSNDINAIKEGKRLFENYVEKMGPANVDALMGGFKCLERLKENEEILDSFQEIAPIFNTFFPLHIEKCRIFLNTGDYENAIDYINNIINKLSTKNFEIYKILAICDLIHEGNFIEAAKNMDKMIDLIFVSEPKNPDLYYSTARLFSRICENRIEILKKCDMLIKKALDFAPKNARYLIEQANYRIQFNELDKAFELLTKAGEIDVNNKDSSFGLIYYKIFTNKLKEAIEDIEFLKDIFKSLQNYVHPKLIYFEAVIKFLYNESEEAVGSVVSEALNTHVKMALQQPSFNKFETLIMSDYDFLFQISKLLMMHYSIFENINPQSIPSNMARAQKILEKIIKNKYYYSAQLLYAKIKYLLGDKSTAINNLKIIIRENRKNIDAYTLMIMIFNDQKDFSKAKEILNEAMLDNLNLSRENVCFLIAKAKCELGLNDTENAQKTLNDALKLFNKFLEENKKINSKSIFQIKPKDKLELLKLNIEILLKLGKIDEAQLQINKLIDDMQDPNMEDDILFLNSELALKTGDVKKAVNLLKKITNKDENTYKESRMKLADIYLTVLMDRRLYTWCYIEILEHFYNFENLKLAGNALIKIDSPDEAVNYYTKALREKNDPIVIRDLGRALVKTHDYKNALNYYIDSLNKFSENLNSNNILVYYEIASDFIAILYQLSFTELNKSTNIKTHLEGFINKLTDDVKKYDEYQLKEKLANFKFTFSKVLKKIYQENKSIDHNDIYKNLEDALKLTKEVLSKLRDLKNESLINTEKEFLSEICLEIGRYYENIEPQLDFAEKAYLESYNNFNSNENALYAISNVYVKKSNLNEAHKFADTLLRLNESNEEAIKLLITIINAKKNNDFTITYLEGILEKQPLSFKLIEIYIDVLRRVGKINKVKDVLLKAEKKLKYTYSPGLNYCRGVYNRYIGEINKALVEFSKSKTDEYYGANCIEQMLEIYMNPDNNIMILDLESPFSPNLRAQSNIIPFNTKDLNLDAIQFLLKELKLRRNDEKTIVYEAYVAMLMRDKNLIDKAIGNLQDILSKSQENVSAWVALAIANMITLKTQEVKTNLKFIEKTSLNIKYYNDYERGILIYAYLMLITENFKKAEELLMKVINELNVSQIKAYDYLGLIKEKQKLNNEACECYEKAWEYSNKSYPIIGHKLAACYLNMRQPIKCINICNEIKKKFKDYPIDDIALQAKNSLNN